MRRRDFIVGLGVSAAWPLAARAQKPVLPVIGWLSSRTSQTDAPLLLVFWRALNAHGYFEGRNISVEYRWAGGRLDLLPTLASDLVGRRIAVIVAVGNGMREARSVQAIDPSMPIVFIDGSDPVKSGFVSSLNHPGGNVTGFIGYQYQLEEKRLGLLHDLLPRAATIAVLVNPNSDTSEAIDIQEAARVLGLQIKVLNAGTERELDAAFERLTQMGNDALFVATSPFFFARAEQIIASAARLALPASYFRREFAAEGGLMSYGSSTEEAYRVLGDYTGRVLKGEKPGNLPVQQPTKFELVINMKTAKALGLTIPETLLATADEVIQ